MKETIKLALILFLITAVAAGILAVSNNYTSEIIAARDAEGLAGSLGIVLPQGKEFQEVDESKLNELISANENILEVNEGYDGEELVGYAIKFKANGYDGTIEMLAGISLENRLTGFEVLSHSETPSLGSRITDDEFIESYTDKTIEEPLVAVESPSADHHVQAIAHATVSSDAVLNAVNNLIETYKSILGN